MYYHRVGAPDPAHLSTTVHEFDRQMGFLARRGYNVITASTLFKWLGGKEKIRFPAVCITFDDGFIDNLVHAHPILQKYGFTAALFVATSLIRPETQAIASCQTDFNNAHTLARRGDFSHFLSASELQFMQNSNTWEIYSHSHLHNQVFTSNRQTGTYPDTDNHWGILSAWCNPLEHGSWPVFQRSAGLVNPGYRPALAAEAIEPGQQEIAHHDLILHRENQSHFQKRVREDLAASLEIIRSICPQNPPLICWPWGKADRNLEQLAAEIGYVGAFRTDTGANSPGMNPFQIRRFPVKKAGLARFALGLLLRGNSLLARAYSLLRNEK